MSEITELLSRHGFRADKSLGQNFLTDGNIMNAVAKAAAGGPRALEIGAGPALLTRKLCSVFDSVVTVELDKTLAPVCAEVLEGVTNHRMVYGDFLKCDIGSLFDSFPVTAVGNLPYNLTGEIVTKLLKNHALFDKAVIMVQKEAADKLLSPPGVKSYRAISALCGYFADMERLFDLPPDRFYPQPRVTSAVLVMKFKKGLLIPPEKENGFFRFVRSLFTSRRKMLCSSFQSKEQREKAGAALDRLQVPRNIRAEQLSPALMAKLYLDLEN